MSKEKMRPQSRQIFYTRDHLGSIRELTDSTGATRARYDYDPYGRRTTLSGDLEADFGFTGHYYHRPSGLHLAMYRGYDAGLGRWLSRDPIGEEGGINLYGYVGNNPINDMDPLGLLSFSDVANFAGGFADTASFGLSKYARQGYLDGLGLSDGEGDDGVDHCSSAYANGGLTATGVGLATGAAGLKAAYAVPKTLYHFTTANAAASISKGGITAGSGLFGTGVYGSSVNVGVAAKLMGAKSIQASVAFSTKGLNVARTLIPGSFKVKSSVPVTSLIK